MKMHKTQYSKLKEELNIFLNKFDNERIIATRKNIRYVKDQYKSFCWYVFRCSGQSNDIRDLYNQGLDDIHIETALKKILIKYKGV